MKRLLSLLLSLCPILLMAQTRLEGQIEISYKKYLPFDGDYIALKNNTSIHLYNIENPSSFHVINWNPQLFNTIPFQIIKGYYLETYEDNYLIKDTKTNKTILEIRELWEWSKMVE
ncbi:hypothetical protein KZP23_16545 [Echinicola marina]|uniref:hypothetical protein n=1 Tax=Echinicola marina TaxID=2859768 RepID=UPI001CF6CB74|nr:hypothetical protein [Echinicola marina]UCS92299.1 hypothetical protein KZP23_16545 [Echinicola marina]